MVKRVRAWSGKSRVLITGGAGFIGSHLCESYLSRGWEVLCLDNFFTGSKDNIRPFLSNSDFELVRHDICDPYLAEVDLVLNFACPASPVHYQNNPIKTLKTNILGTMNMLGLAKRTGARFVQASTSEVYGDPLEHPQKENYFGHVNPVGIRSCYDEGKRAAETLASDYKRTHNMDVRIIRIFNTYGPRMAANDGRVISNLIVQGIQGDSLTIYGDGSQTRSFCYIDDLVSGITRIGDKDGEFGPVNLGNATEHTINDIAERVSKLSGSDRKIVRKPLPSDDPRRRCPDLTLARDLINYEPKVPLDEGLKKTYDYFREKLKS
ncbi:MAG: UDP-glucuronic acid decarboxylase family protein [Oligoflexales bacterium]